MARKVFISILGTGYYNRTKYYWKEKDNLFETRFIQEATMKLLTKNWDKKDKAYFFLTEKSKTTNWEHPAQKEDYRVKNGERDAYKGLEVRIKELGLNYGFKTVDISDGNNEQEIWQIFEEVFYILEENDEVYFDITHAFRSIPMLVMVLINYAKFLKNIKVKSITYGNWEGRDKDNNLAPIIDLTAFSELQDWTSASMAFNKFGRTSEIIKLLKETNNDVEMYDFTKDIISNRGIEILSSIKIIELKKLLSKHDFNNAPFEKIKSSIIQKLSRFKQNNVNNGFKAVEFCIENGLIQQGITLLQEFIVTRVMHDIGLIRQDEIKSRNYRNIITTCLQFTEVANIEPERFLTVNDKKSEQRKNKKVIKYNNWINAVFKISYKENLTNDIFSDLADKIRNDINHAGFRTEPLAAEDFESFLKEKFEQTKLLFNLK